MPPQRVLKAAQVDENDALLEGGGNVFDEVQSEQATVGLSFDVRLCRHFDQRQSYGWCFPCRYADPARCVQLQLHHTVSIMWQRAGLLCASWTHHRLKLKGNYVDHLRKGMMDIGDICLSG